MVEKVLQIDSRLPPELLIDACQVTFHRLFAYEESLGDPGVDQSFCPSSATLRSAGVRASVPIRARRRGLARRRVARRAARSARGCARIGTPNQRAAEGRQRLVVPALADELRSQSIVPWPFERGAGVLKDVDRLLEQGQSVGRRSDRSGRSQGESQVRVAPKARESSRFSAAKCRASVDLPTDPRCSRSWLATTWWQD